MSEEGKKVKDLWLLGGRTTARFFSSTNRRSIDRLPMEANSNFELSKNQNVQTNDEELSEFERRLRHCLECLNQPINLDMSDKAAGVILDHQLLRVGYLERLLHSALGVCGVIVIIKLYGFSTRRRTVWELLKLSMIFGAFAGISRCIQLQHRLYSAFHEIFYIYLNFFLVGICMSLRVTERFSTATSKDRSQ
ncbi:hypothetical protein M3Y98_00104700 [Aphelenchoides besseyi]|nr:hypothetical protein M3Y98_00104700 [Aphelenchoides besseyi]KAI6194472.1 hypothetical protein M3Y96_01128500 [Aphelenchoides besseyi]